MELEGKVAIVTGGANGIGRATSLQLAREGATVVVVDINLEAATGVANEIKERGGRARAIKTDVANAQSVNHMVEEAIRELGKIDILVNNAAVGDPLTPLAETTEASWDRMIDVNLKGTYLCLRTVMPYMMKAQSGRIVNLASGQWFRPVVGLTMYAASKGGVAAFSKSAALELAPYNVNVNAVAPGFTDTPFSRSALPGDAFEYASTQTALKPPLGRINQPEDVAEAIVFLVKPCSRNITGQNLHVNGGSLMW